MARLIAVAGPAAGEEFPLSQTQIIGRLERCDITIPDASVSREHARLTRRPDGYLVVDLNSSNGILVNGERVRRTLLKAGDQLLVGKTLFRLEGVEEEEERPAARRRGRTGSAAEIAFGAAATGTSAASTRVLLTKREDGPRSSRRRQLWIFWDLEQMGGIQKALVLLGLFGLVLGLGALAYLLVAG